MVKKFRFLTDNAMKLMNLVNLMKLMEHKDVDMDVDVELFKFKFLTRNTNNFVNTKVNTKFKNRR